MRSDYGGSREDELRELVDRTRGAQPWRRVAHAVAGCLVVGTVTILDFPPRVIAGILGGVLVLQVVLDSARLRSPRLNILFFRCFQSLASPREAEGSASGTWYVAGVALVLALFPLEAAVTGILVLALADPAASYLGRRYGRVRLGRGTLEGSLIFFSVALATALLTVPLSAALSVAGVATIVESLPLPLDDNLTIPLAGAAAAALALGV